MITRIALVLALLVTPALAQDASSASSSSSSLAPSSEMASSGEPAISPDVSSSAPPLPGGLSDTELEMAVRAAYSAAATFAAAHGNYFARDGVTAPLRDAVAAAVGSAYPAVTVPAEPFADLDAARACLPAPGTELRLAPNTYGDGITLVAVSDSRVFAYDYDPHKAAEIKVLAAADCIKPK